MPVCLSACQHGTTRFPLDGFWLNLILEYFSKISRRENSSFIKIWQEYLLIYMTTNTHFWSCDSVLLRMRNVSDRNCKETRNTRFTTRSFSFFFFRKSCRLWDNVEKYCSSGQATGGNMTYSHFMLHTQGYKNTLRILLCTAAVIARTRLNIALYVHYLSYFLLFLTDTKFHTHII